MRTMALRLALALVLALVVSALLASLDIVEYLYAASRQYERYELDDMVFIFPFAACVGLMLVMIRQSREHLQHSGKIIREQRWSLEAIFEYSFQSIFLTRRADGVILAVNPRLCRTLGLRAKDVIGKTTVDLKFWKSDADRLALLDELNRGGQVESREAFIEKADGGFVYGLFATKPVTYKDEDCLLTMFIDLTERKLFEREMQEARLLAEEASRVKSDFLTNMSHEIRTPLNGVMGILQLLRDEDLKPEQASLVNLAFDASTRLLALLNDILDLARIESGKAVSCIAPFDLKGGLAGVGATFAIQAGAKGLDLSVAVDPSIPDLVAGDEGHLRQILFNLVGNALKFTDQGGVEMAVERLDDGRDPAACRVLFRIADTGLGIDRDKLDFIFDHFYQADSGLARKFGGSGLGLSIVKSLVVTQGGGLCFDSQPGQGTEVFFDLPLAIPPAGASAPDKVPEAPPPPLGRDIRVLVAEDEPINQLTMRKFVERLGCVCLLAGDGEEAFRMFTTHHCDVILMDVQMPGMDGFQATAAIRASGLARSDVPIIAVTAHAMRGYRDQVIEAGMNDYLSKPVDFENLRDVLARHLAGRRDA